jgi:hypothetical protein
MQLGPRVVGRSDTHSISFRAKWCFSKQPELCSSVRLSQYRVGRVSENGQLRFRCCFVAAAGPDVPTSTAQTCFSPDLSIHHSSSSSRGTPRCAATATTAPVLVAEMEQLHLKLNAIESSMHMLHTDELDSSCSSSSSASGQEHGAGASVSRDTAGSESCSQPADLSSPRALWTPPKPSVWLPDGRASLARAARLAGGPEGDSRSSRSAASSTAVQSTVATTAATRDRSSAVELATSGRRLTNVYMASAEVSCFPVLPSVIAHKVCIA